MLKTSCDLCKREFIPNREIPRIIILKYRKDELRFVPLFVQFDYCDICIIEETRRLARGRTLGYREVRLEYKPELAHINYHFEKMLQNQEKFLNQEEGFTR